MASLQRILRLGASVSMLWGVVSAEEDEDERSLLSHSYDADCGPLVKDTSKLNSAMATAMEYALCADEKAKAGESAAQMAAQLAQERAMMDAHQKMLMAREETRARAAEAKLSQAVEAAQTNFLEELESKVREYAQRDASNITAEKARTAEEMAALQDSVEALETKTLSDIQFAQDTSFEAETQRDLLFAQLSSFKKGVFRNLCPPPTGSALNWQPHLFIFATSPNVISSSVGCPDAADPSSCLESNKAFDSVEEAWAKCATVEGCGRLMNFSINNKIYLRRRADLNGLEEKTAEKGHVAAVAHFLDFECMPLCPTECQRQCDATGACGGVCSHCAYGGWREGGSRCSTPLRGSEFQAFVNASGSCDPGLTDCRVCTFDKATLGSKATTTTTTAAAAT
eukprot:TRINITY_DN122076_c0_g1_i1.p1 TRINITY_DN122076_c0_g1~~TRINITY_DN122076_c0_g1_i1.p1  ORF type:complete len:398 (-),score=84.71 TRINITY_DN122076_c0_g1_i1:151-1344(-)